MTNYRKLREIEEQIGGKLWTKNGICRLYIDNFGYNTKKSQTSVYLHIVAGKVKVEVFLDCPTQHWNWIKAERKRILTKVNRQVKNLKPFTKERVKFIPCNEATQTFSYTRTDLKSSFTPLYDIIKTKPKK